MPDSSGRIKGISLAGVSNPWLDSLERRRPGVWGFSTADPDWRPEPITRAEFIAKLTAEIAERERPVLYLLSSLFAP